MHTNMSNLMELVEHSVFNIQNTCKKERSSTTATLTRPAGVVEDVRAEKHDPMGPHRPSLKLVNLSLEEPGHLND